MAAAGANNLTLTGGSGGATLILGQGSSGEATFDRTIALRGVNDARIYSQSISATGSFAGFTAQYDVSTNGGFHLLSPRIGATSHVTTAGDYDTYLSTRNPGNSLLFAVGNVEKMRIAGATGNVGIGTTNPASTLEVFAGADTSRILWGATIRNNGNADATGYGAGLRLKLSSDATPYELYKWSGLAAVAGTGYANRTDLAFYTDATAASAPAETMRLTGTGNLGLGATAPHAKLEIVTNGESLRLSTASEPTSYFTSILNLYDSTHPFSLRVANNSVTATEFMGVYADMGGANNRLAFTNGRVGIGTTNPAAHFELNRNGTGGSNFVRMDGGGGANGNLLQVQAVDYSDPYPLVAFTTAHSMTTRTNNLVRIHSNETGAGSLPLRVTAQGSMDAPTFEAIAVDYLGNVGIGTTTPVGKLNISATGDSNVRITGTGAAGRAQVVFDSPGGAWQVEDAATGAGNHPAGALGITESGVGPRFTILRGGNVGIGTTNPGAKLDVAGDARVTGSLTVLGAFSAANWSASGLTGGASGLTLNAGGTDQGILLAPSGTGKVRVDAAGAAGTNARVLRLGVAQAADGSSASLEFGTTTYDALGQVRGGVETGSNGFLAFDTRAGGTGYERLRITSNGNVAIGTATPNLYGAGNGTFLTLAGSGSNAASDGRLELANPKSTVAAGDSVGDIVFTAPNNPGAEKRSAGMFSLLAGNGGANGFGGTLELFTKADNASTFNPVVLDRAGNFGIGNTAPTAKLDVSGDIKASTSVSAPYLLANYPYGDAFPIQAIAPNASKAANIYYGILLGTGEGGSSRLEGGIRIQGNGDPALRGLAISAYENGYGPRDVFVPFGNFNVQSGNITVSGSGTFNGNLSVNGTFTAANFAGTGTTTFSGNVGIGTATAPARLAVTGSYSDLNTPQLAVDGGSVGAVLGLATAGVQRGKLRVDSSGAVALESSGTGGLDFNWSGGSGDTRFWDGNGASLLIIKHGGNVGIGTTTPDKPLTVKGTIHATEVVVDTTVAARDLKVKPKAWADDVFDPNHPLAPLSDVEQRIKADGHLPGVPSAQQVAADGVSVADMQAVLLRKIEELTLHQIEQEKRMRARDQQDADMAARITKLEAENAALRAQLQ